MIKANTEMRTQDSAVMVRVEQGAGLEMHPVQGLNESKSNHSIHIFEENKTA